MASSRLYLLPPYRFAFPAECSDLMVPGVYSPPAEATSSGYLDGDVRGSEQNKGEESESDKYVGTDKKKKIIVKSVRGFCIFEMLGTMA